jgi:hypothetical protein
MGNAKCEIRNAKRENAKSDARNPGFRISDFAFRISLSFSGLRKLRSSDYTGAALGFGFRVLRLAFVIHSQRKTRNAKRFFAYEEMK